MIRRVLTLAIFLSVLSVSQASLAQVSGWESAKMASPTLAFSLPGVGLADASTEAEPSSGLGLIIPGWILTGVGAANLATMPLCFADFYEDFGVKEVCIAGSIVFAGVGLGLGVPFLIVGYGQRRRHKAWERGHVAAHLSRTRVVPLDGGGLASYSFQF